MNIHSVDNINFSSKADRDFTPYNPRRNPRHNIDTIISMNDDEVRKLAYIKTLNNVEDKKHHNASKIMIAASPLAAGAASAILKPSKFNLFSRELTGSFARLMNGAKSAGKLGVLLGTVYGINFARSFFENKSPNFDRFTSENPLLTFGASVAAFAGTVALGAKGAAKLTQIAVKNIKPSSIVRFDNKLADSANKFNSNNIVSAITHYARNIKNMKGIEPLSVIAPKTLGWSPLILLGMAMLNEWNHGRAKDLEFLRNYSEMKNIQNKLAQARINELGLQNKVLKAELAANTINK